MREAVEAAMNGVRMVPCPACGERALGAPHGGSPVSVACGRCGARFDALADVLVVSDDVRLKGGCCAGWRRHELAWHEDAQAPVQELTFWTWAQDHVTLGAGDTISLLFPDGDLRRPHGRRKRLMPLVAADHTRRHAWALVGSAPIATLR
jgi:hypothetical protein